MITLKTRSAALTMQVGEILGGLLKKGDLICLTGALGTGKTAFTGGIALALGISRHITSPTFTIVNEYEAALTLYHFDVYRISDPDEMFEIGFEEYLYSDGVVVIEWADIIKELLPRDYIRVSIEKCMQDDPDTRVISIEFKGSGYKLCEEAFLSKINAVGINRNEGDK